MGTLPTPTVLLDDGSGTFPYDISAYVLSADGYQITRGRDDWQGAVTTGQVTLTLNNSDGRFTPGSTILGTPSPIKVDAQILLSEAIGTGGGWDTGGWGVGGWDTGSTASYTRFTGYVKSWPVSWPATVTTFSTVQITATDAQARAERHTLRSMLEEEILLGDPDLYYTLGEAQDSTAAGDTSGNQQPALSIVGNGTSPTFGTGAGPTPDLPATQFFGGRFLASSTAPAAVTAPPVYGLGASFSTSTTPGSLTVIAFSHGYALFVDSSGFLVGGGPGFTLSSTVSVVDGKTHNAALVWGPPFLGGWRLIMDGAILATAFATPTGSVLAVTYVGGSPLGPSFTGTVAHVYAGATITTPVVSNIVFIADGALETANARLARLASYAGLTVGTLDASLTQVAAQATSGVSAQSAMQDAADAALGVVYIDGSGALTFHDGTRVAGKSSPDLSISSQYVTPDVVPTVDDQRLVNYIEATASGTGGVSVAQNQASEDTHGRYPDSVTYVVPTDQQALDRANWTIAKLADPTPRFGTLTINLYKMNTTDAQTVLSGLDIDCWLRVNSLASQNPGGTVADVVVQGWQETTTGESWSITCNVVARSLFNAFIVGDPVYGIPDSALAPVFV